MPNLRYDRYYGNGIIQHLLRRQPLMSVPGTKRTCWGGLTRSGLEGYNGRAVQAGTLPSLTRTGHQFTRAVADN